MTNVRPVNGGGDGESEEGVGEGEVAMEVEGACLLFVGMGLRDGHADALFGLQRDDLQHE